MKSLFHNPLDLVAEAQGDEHLRKQVRTVLSRRYMVMDDVFERLLWLLVANAACAGARMALDEMMRERKNGVAQ